jgi:hypothetical protein
MSSDDTSKRRFIVITANTDVIDLTDKRTSESASSVSDISKTTKDSLEQSLDRLEVIVIPDTDGYSQMVSKIQRNLIITIVLLCVTISLLLIYLIYYGGRND